jgi:N-acetylglucosamine malate deacetylase 1
MNAKKLLKRAQKLVPETLLTRLQKLHANLLFTFISRRHQALSWSQKSAMVFSPHQDDETFGCGGMIALKRAQGIAVQVIFLTDGQGSDQLNPQIVQIRASEALTALRNFRS